MKNTTICSICKDVIYPSEGKKCKKTIACPIKMPERKEQLVDIQTPPKNDKENKKHN